MCAEQANKFSIVILSGAKNLFDQRERFFVAHDAPQNDETNHKIWEVALITCPNCGNQVREGVQFCNRCGTDIQAALAMNPRPLPVSEGQPAPYAYSQPTPNYGAYDAPAPSSSGRTRILLLGCIALLAFCCAIGWGIVAIEAILTLTSGGGPAPTPTPRGFVSPSDIQVFVQLLVG